MTTVAVADLEARQALREFGEKVVPVGCAIGPAQFIFGNIGPYQPVAQRQGDIDGPTGLSRQIFIHLPNGSNQCAEVEAGEFIRHNP